MWRTRTLGSYSQKTTASKRLPSDDRRWLIPPRSNADIGANASTEETGDDLEAGSRTVIDVVDYFGLVNIGVMDKMMDKVEGKKPESEYFSLYLKRKAPPLPLRV